MTNLTRVLISRLVLVAILMIASSVWAQEEEGDILLEVTSTSTLTETPLPTETPMLTETPTETALNSMSS